MGAPVSNKPAFNMAAAQSDLPTQQDDFNLNDVLDLLPYSPRNHSADTSSYANLPATRMARGPGQNKPVDPRQIDWQTPAPVKRSRGPSPASTRGISPAFANQRVSPGYSDQRDSPGFAHGNSPNLSGKNAVYMNGQTSPANIQHHQWSPNFQQMSQPMTSPLSGQHSLSHQQQVMMARQMAQKRGNIFSGNQNPLSRQPSPTLRPGMIQPAPQLMCSKSYHYHYAISVYWL